MENYNKNLFFSTNLVLFYFLCFPFHQVSAQSSSAIYSNTHGEVKTSSSSNLSPTFFLDIQNASSPSLQDYALISPGLLTIFTEATMRIPLSGKAEAGSRAGVLVGQNQALANAHLLSYVTIKTYLAGICQESAPVSATLLSAALLSNATTPVQLEFVTKKDFDAVELIVHLPAGLSLNSGDGLRVYYAYGVKRNVLEEVKGYLSRFDPATEERYSTTSRNNGSVVLCVNSQVQAPLNAVDFDLSNYASFSSLITVNCPSTLKVQLEGTASANFRAGFVVETSGLLDVAALEALTLTTYLNGVKQESASGINLLQVNVLPGLEGQSSNKYYLSFATTTDFNYVEIRRNSLLDVLENLRIYYGFGIEDAAFSGTNRIFSNYASPQKDSEYLTAQNTLICVNDCNGFNHPERAADLDLKTNFASLTGLASVATTRSLSLRLTQSGKAGNRAGIVAGLNNGLLSADLLANITITTYSTDGTTLLESATGSDLISLGILNNSQNELFFYPTQDFSWVEIKVKGAVAVLENSKVYYAFADDRPITSLIKIVPSVPLPVKLISFKGKTMNMSNVLTWETASEMNSSHFVVERSSDLEAGFVAVGTISSAGNSNTRKQYTFNDAGINAHMATLYYYRLRQVDFDGAEEFSKVISIRSTQKLLVSLVVFPNPVSRSGVFRMSLNAATAQKIHLYNSEGRLVWQTFLTQETDNNFKSPMNPGLYVIIAYGNQGEILATERLIVQP